MKVLLFFMWLLTSDIVPPPADTPQITQQTPQQVYTAPKQAETRTMFYFPDFSFLQRPNVNATPYTPPQYPDHSQEDNCKPIYYEGQPSGLYDC